MYSKIPFRAIDYQWELSLYDKGKNVNNNTNKINNIQFKYSKINIKKFGYTVISRQNGIANNITFSIYTKDYTTPIYIVGEFNKWGKIESKELEKFKLTSNGEFSSITINSIKHQSSYLFMTNNAFMRDPASTYFDNDGNSVFWDFSDPSAYKSKYPSPELTHRATKILQTDPIGLVSRWYEYSSKSKPLHETKEDLFTYISTCGVLEKIKELGFNTLQFLPITQSIDGDQWKYRYLVAYPFAIQKNFGSPNSLKKLIDKCHKLGIAFVSDVIISHCPDKDFSLFKIKGEDIGIHLWKDNNNQSIYLKDSTPWGTKRYNYSDHNIRQFLTDSVTSFIEHYNVDGFRIDNVDGILRLGISGDGKDRPFGRDFLRYLITSIYNTKKDSIVNLESHYFYGDNAKMLVAKLTSDERALGATAYNSSRLTYFFHKDYMPKSADKISLWVIENIRKEKEWGKSNSTIADFHNHDAAAGLMEGRATGSYAYDAMTLNNPNLHQHAFGKIQVMEALIAFAMEGRILDLLQTFQLQTGTFEHDNSIHWINEINNSSSKQMLNFKSKINALMDSPAFWPENNINRKYTNVDNNNKILTIKRTDKTQNTNDTFYILINLSGETFNNYGIGVNENSNFKIILDNANRNFGGNTNNRINSNIHSTSSHFFEHFSKQITIDTIQPYQVLIFQKINEK